MICICLSVTVASWAVSLACIASSSCRRGSSCSCRRSDSRSGGIGNSCRISCNSISISSSRSSISGKIVVSGVVVVGG